MTVKRLCARFVFVYSILCSMKACRWRTTCEWNVHHCSARWRLEILHVRLAHQSMIRTECLNNDVTLFKSWISHKWIFSSDLREPSESLGSMSSSVGLLEAMPSGFLRNRHRLAFLTLHLEYLEEVRTIYALPLNMFSGKRFVSRRKNNTVSRTVFFLLKQETLPWMIFHLF